MSTNLLIFDTESDILGDQTNILKTEKNLFYESWISDSKQKDPDKITKKELEGFYEMEKYDQDTKFMESTIDVILLQQILSYVIPIIDKLPPNIHSKPNSKRVQISNERKASVQLKQTIKKEQRIKSSLIKKYITLKPTTNTICLYNNNEISIPAASTVQVIGIRLNKNINSYQHNYIYNYLINSPNELDNESNFEKLELIISGKVQLYNFLSNEFFKFGEMLHTTNKHDIIFEKHNSSITGMLRFVTNIIKSANEYYNNRVWDFHNYIYKLSTDYSSVEKSQIDKNQIDIKSSNNKISTAYDGIVKNINKILGTNYQYDSLENIKHSIFNDGYLDYFDIVATLNDKNIYNELKRIAANKNESLTNSRNPISIKSKDSKKLKDEKLINLYETNDDFKLVSALYNAIDRLDRKNIKKLLHKLEVKYGAKLLSDKPIKINDIILICPHNIYQAKFLVEQKYDQMIEMGILRNELFAKYLDNTVNSHICKICGELLISDEDITEVSKGNNDYNSLSDDINMPMINKEAYYVFNNFVSFDNINQQEVMLIIKNCVDLISDEISKINSTLLKIKTVNKDEITATLIIYINIYVFAYITHLMYTNGNLKFQTALFGNRSDIEVSPIIGSRESKTRLAPRTIGDLKGNKKLAEKSTEKKLAKKASDSIENARKLQRIISTAIAILLKIKQKELLESKIITHQSIKPLFLKAYRWIIRINYTLIAYSTVSFWDINNPIIEYFIDIYKRSAEPSSKLVTQAKTINYETAFEKVMGRPKAQIEEEIKKVTIYDTLAKPNEWETSKYHYESVMMLYEYIKDNLSFESADSKKITDYFIKFNFLKEDELQIHQNSLIKRTLPLYKLPFVEYKYESSSQKLRNCSNCEKIYLYKKLNKYGNFIGESKEVNHKDIIQWLESKDSKKLNEFSQLVLYEIRCKCSSKYSADYKKLKPFFDFYANRCPKGDLHEFDKNNKCTKCGLTADLLNNMDNGYYNKFREVYNKLRLREYESMNKTLNQSNKILTRKENAEYKLQKTLIPGWKSNGSVINKLASALEININEFLNIGLYEKKIYDPTFKTELLPRPSNADEYINYSNNLKNYYLFIIRTFDILRKIDTTPRAPAFLKNFSNKFSIANITKKFASIGDDFMNTYYVYKNTLNPKDLSQFLLESMAEILLKIKDIFTKHAKTNAGLAFIKLMFNKIIESEKILSKFDIRQVLKEKFMRDDIDLNDGMNDLAGDDNLDDIVLDNDDGDERILFTQDTSTDDIDDTKENIYIDDKDELYENDDSFAIDNVDVEEYGEDSYDNLYNDISDKIA